MRNCMGKLVKVIIFAALLSLEEVNALLYEEIE